MSLGIVQGESAPGEDAAVALLANGGLVCSGALIADSVVLTAAHCVLDPDSRELRYRSDLCIAVGADARQPSELVAVAEVWSHPSFHPLYDGYDIAALRLESSVDVRAYTPLRAAAPPPLPSEVVRVLGFGAEHMDAPDASGRRLQATSRILDVSERVVRLERPAATCSGDSGGPALLRRDDQELLAGLHARSDCEADSIFTRVDVYDDTMCAFGTCPGVPVVRTQATCVPLRAVDAGTRPRGCDPPENSEE